MTAKRRVFRAAVALGRALRLPQLMDRLERFMPDRLLYWERARRRGARRGAGDVTRQRPLDKPLLPERELEEKYREVLSLLLERNEAGDMGDYLEFGVYVGRSLSCMHRALAHHGLDHVRLFGFDSFEGLPASAASEDRARWEPGEFSVDLETALRFLEGWKVDMSRVTLVKGWFDDTLTTELAERHSIRKASVIMIDCDLYSSSKTALDFCANLIADDAVILFDDWSTGGLAEKRLGERKAFEEFLEAHPTLSARELGGYSEFSTAFLVSRSPVAVG